MPDQNTLTFGYRRAGGGDVIVSLGLNSLAAAIDSASQLTLGAFLRNPDGSQGSAVTLPPDVQSTAVDVKSIGARVTDESSRTRFHTRALFHNLICFQGVSEGSEQIQSAIPLRRFGTFA